MASFFGSLFYLFLIAFLFVIYLVRHPLLRLAGGFWIVNESPQTSDAIVILSDDNYNGDRAAEAADIFKAGWAPRVIASGRYLRPYAGIAELEARDLESHGVPESAIVPFSHHASDTREECIAIGQLMSSRGWKRILLVTSNYHTRRSEYICERAFPQGTALRVIAAPDSEYDPRLVAIAVRPEDFPPRIRSGSRWRFGRCAIKACRPSHPACFPRWLHPVISCRVQPTAPVYT